MVEPTRRDALRMTLGCGMVLLGPTACAEAPATGHRHGNGPPTAGALPPSSRPELAEVFAVPDGGALNVSAAAGAPTYLVRRGESVRLLSAICTHGGCLVAWQAGRRRFLCPCHNGSYSQQGLVVAGPPPRPLAELPIAVDRGAVYRAGGHDRMASGWQPLP